MAEQSASPSTKYLNKKISLLSTSAVRYIGQLHTIDPEEPSISLRNVQCLGTEDRRSGHQAIAASSQIYEFIKFRANNIKSLYLEKNNQKIDLNKEILDPLRLHVDATHNTQETQPQSTTVKSSDKQRNKPSIVSDEPKRKVGIPQQPNYGPYDYYSQRSPQYGAMNQYDYGIDYPPIPSPYQTAQDTMYSPNYPYDDPNYSQHVNFSQIAPPQPQSSYNSTHDSQILGNEFYYQQKQPQNYGFGGPHSSGQTNVSFANQSTQRYNRSPNYRQYPTGNYGYFQPNANRSRYPNDRNQERGRGGYGGIQGNQRYYNENQKQWASGGRRDGTNYTSNQAPGTGAYLDRRLRGNELDISGADFHFGSSKAANDQNDITDEKQISKEETTNSLNVQSIDNEKEKNQSNEEKPDKQKETTTLNNEQNAAANKTEDDKTTRKSAYDKNKSFFDTITTDADIKKQQKQENLEEQRKNDTETFGSVAETYRSRHGQKQLNNENNKNYNRPNNNNQRNFNQRRNNYGYNQPQKYNNNYRRYDNQFDVNQPFFNSNQQRWVQKRPN